VKRTREESLQIQQRCNSVTKYQNGNKPMCTKPDGFVSLRVDKRGIPYKFIKISDNNWIYLQIYNWEEKYGKIPSGKVLRCQNGDTLYTDPANWYLIDKAENLEKNAGRADLEDRYIASILSMRDKEKRKQFEAMPELIELKRNQLKLRRTINEFSETSKVD
jgi:hypothetical protein